MTSSTADSSNNRKKESYLMADQTDRFADYVDVGERIKIFRELHPEGTLQPLNPAEPFQIVQDRADRRG